MEGKRKPRGYWLDVVRNMKVNEPIAIDIRYSWGLYSAAKVLGRKLKTVETADGKGFAIVTEIPEIKPEIVTPPRSELQIEILRDEPHEQEFRHMEKIASIPRWDNARLRPVKEERKILYISIPIELFATIRSVADSRGERIDGMIAGLLDDVFAPYAEEQGNDRVYGG